MKLTTAQRTKFIELGAKFTVWHLINLYHAFEARVKETPADQPLVLTDELLGISHNVVMVSTVLAGIRDEYVKANPGYKDLFDWMDIMVKEHKRILAEMVAKDKEADATQSTN
jgi:hypothetical protein